MDNVHLYKTPSPKMRHNRKVFYGLHRKFAEPIEKWLKRVENRISRCNFAEFTEFLLIDKFFSELDNSEMDILQSERRTWSIKKLWEYLWVENVDAKPAKDTEGNAPTFDKRNGKSTEIVSVDLMDYESVCLLN